MVDDAVQPWDRVALESEGDSTSLGKYSMRSGLCDADLSDARLGMPTLRIAGQASNRAGLGGRAGDVSREPRPGSRRTRRGRAALSGRGRRVAPTPPGESDVSRVEVNPCRVSRLALLAGAGVEERSVFVGHTLPWSRGAESLWFFGCLGCRSGRGRSFRQ